MLKYVHHNHLTGQRLDSIGRPFLIVGVRHHRGAGGQSSWRIEGSVPHSFRGESRLADLRQNQNKSANQEERVKKSNE